MRYCLFLLAFAAGWLVPVSQGLAQSPGGEEIVPSKCIAMAQDMHRNGFGQVLYASLAVPAQGREPEVKFTYAGHSTYVIETPEGVRIATDFSGIYGTDPVPDVVTMNKAHSTHFTSHPDPRIRYVLPGWNPEGGPAKHRLVVGDVYIRNVTTDIRAGFGTAEKDGNSIFIFEVANLCIGHLGHLHHELDDTHYAAIGRLDIVMVPVDGGLTLNHAAMSRITKRLQSSIVLPMHRRFTTIESFLSGLRDDFDIEFRNDRSFIVSARTLPRRPTILILNGI